MWLLFVAAIREFTCFVEGLAKHVVVLDEFLELIFSLHFIVVASHEFLDVSHEPIIVALGEEKNL